MRRRDWRIFSKMEILKFSRGYSFFFFFFEDDICNILKIKRWFVRIWARKVFTGFESDTVRVCAQSIALYRNPLCEIRPRPFRYRHPWIIYISVWTIYTENAITSYKFVVGHLVKLWKNILNCISEERKKILQFQILSLIVSLPLLTISIKLVIFVNWKFVF